MQLSDVIGSVRRHWRVSVAIILLAGIGLMLFLFTRNEVRGEDRWKASVKLLVPVRTDDGTVPNGVPPSLLQGQAQLALSGATTANALQGAGVDTGSRNDVDFAFTTNAPANPDEADKNPAARGDIITLTATTPDRDVSIRVADSFARAYRQARMRVVAAADKSSQAASRNALVKLEARLDQVVNELRATAPQLLTPTTPTPEGATPPALELPNGTPLDTVLLAAERQTLVDRIATLRAQYAESITGSLVPDAFAAVVERPLPLQIVPELPSPLLPIALAIGAGLLLAIAVPVVIDRLDHTIRDGRGAGNALAAPVLSTIPPTNMAALARPGSVPDGAYRALAATSIATDQLPRAILVTSPLGASQDGVAANFAASLAGLGLTVALVATDHRQSWYLDMTDREREAHGSRTLPDLLALVREGSLNGQIRDQLVPSRLAHLAVLPPGTADGDALLDGLPALLESLADAGVDVTVIAGPALLEDPSATIFAWSTRSVLWVVEAGEITDQEAREAAARLELAGASPFGIAMVEAKG